jgi:hypothetical protein
MTIFSRWCRDLLERLLGRYKEGPDPPPRLADDVHLFRLRSPGPPTEEEWAAFAERLAERAYRDGYARGVHWLERSWDGPALGPEKVLELEASAADRLFPEGARPSVKTAREVHEVHEAIYRAAAAGIDVHLERPLIPRRIR